MSYFRFGNSWKLNYSLSLNKSLQDQTKVVGVRSGYHASSNRCGLKYVVPTSPGDAPSNKYDRRERIERLEFADTIQKNHFGFTVTLVLR
jgi:hypothetical protein